MSYKPGTGFGAWNALYGIFATDPAVTSCADGSVYLVGKDSWNSLWSGRYIPGTGFQGFVFGGGVIKGKPSITCGSDNAVYVVAKDNWDSHWMARVSGNTWTGWYYGGAISSVDPKIAALGGSVAVVILGPTGVVWRTTFTEGTGNGWQPWTSVGGVLQDIAPAAVNGELYFIGRAAEQRTLVVAADRQPVDVDRERRRGGRRTGRGAPITRHRRDPPGNKGAKPTQELPKGLERLSAKGVLRPEHLIMLAL